MIYLNSISSIELVNVSSPGYLILKLNLITRFSTAAGSLDFINLLAVKKFRVE